MGERKNLEELKELLYENEEIEKRMIAFNDNKEGILAITTKRLLFVGKGLFSGLAVMEFPFDSVHSVEYQLKFTEGIVTLHSSEDETVFEGIPESKEDIKSFIDHLNFKLEQPEPVSEPNGNDFISQLERLAKLKEQGILTEEEFQEQKEKILDQS